MAVRYQLEKEPGAWPWLIPPPHTHTHSCLLESPPTPEQPLLPAFPKWKELWLNIPEPSGCECSIQQRGAGVRGGQRGVMKGSCQAGEEGLGEGGRFPLVIWRKGTKSRGVKQGHSKVVKLPPPNTHTSPLPSPKLL